MEEYRPELRTIQFTSGRKSKLLEVLPTISSSVVCDWLQLPPVRFAIAMHLGAMEMDDHQRHYMRDLLANSVIRFAEDNRCLVADGGTNAGVMQIVGDAYEDMLASFPLVGVTVKDSVSYPGGPEPATHRWALNEAHTHFVIVESSDFGAESQLLVGMAKAAGLGLAISINGGGIVRAEIEMHARLGTPIIVMKGTGRYSDELANALETSEIRAAFDEGSYLEIFDINKQTAEDLYHMIRRILLR